MSGAELLLAVGELGAAPSPSDGGEFNQVTVSPGLPGFFAMFALAVVVVLLLMVLPVVFYQVRAYRQAEEER